MIAIPERWDLEADVVVIGSGAAGLTAAIIAHDRGARVAMLERSDKVGGASACSGGMVWVPLNHHMSELGISDSKEEAMTYVRRLAAGRSEDALLEAFIDAGPVMVRYMEENTPSRFEASGMPDYHPDFAGAKPAGRSLNPKLFNSRELGDRAHMVRPAPQLFAPMSIDEIVKEWHAVADPKNMRFDILKQRRKEGLVAMGQALIYPLFNACLDRAIPIHLETRAKRLVVEDEVVVGLQADRQGQDFYIRAMKGVILACGGFEWNDALNRQFLPGCITHPITPPFAEGDGLKMAMEVGAQLANMSEAWWMTALHIPGEEYEGQPLSRASSSERALPHSILVNRQGRRFVNEALNYNDLVKAFNTIDPNTLEYANFPTWIIFDANFRERYACMNLFPGEPDPAWLARADTIAAIALKLGIDSQGLEETVKRFNEFAAEGVDRDFHRGETIYEQLWADPSHKPNPCLGPIAKPPFYALPVYRSAIGTKGGPKVNTKGQVLNVHGDIIAGLYAAGNVMAAVTGPGYGGHGGTLGPAMTWAFICGNTITQEASKGGPT